MKLRFPWRRKPAAQSRVLLARDLSTPLYQALIQIRDHPKHARKKAKEALAGPRPFRYLYRALVQIKAQPWLAAAIADSAIADAQTASRLCAALTDIRDKPKEAEQLASYAVLMEAHHGARK
jgi:hypothetical protein